MFMSDANISALSALGTVQQVSANNVANVNTDGFAAGSVTLESGPGGQGVRVGDIREGGATDLATEMVTMMRTENAFSANTTAIRASEEMTGHLLNMIG
jgi:flagellar basal-body rod protein FlgC